MSAAVESFRLFILGTLCGLAVQRTRAEEFAAHGLTGREILLVVARHAAEHWGEAQLMRNLLTSRSSAEA